MAVLLLWAVVLGGAEAQLFQAPLFSSGMILQRGEGTRVWGANATGPVTVTVSGGIKASSGQPGEGGSWMVSLPSMAASLTSTVTATDGKTTETLTDVAIGDVILCGGQSNMGFGMCGATVIADGPHPQTPAQALAALPTGNNPLRFFNQHGDANGGAGSTVKGNVCKEPCTTSNNGMDAKAVWYKAGKDNAGSASAVCLLTAQSLRKSLGGSIPVGAVNSCVGGTPVEPWTPPLGDLYVQHIKPLLPMKFKAALWDQGERDEVTLSPKTLITVQKQTSRRFTIPSLAAAPFGSSKTTNTTWYATEFPKMIDGWRSAFQTPDLPFVYVEICHENGAEEPKEKDFWEFGQRAAITLPKVGFATTTDIDKSALHPPDKQDIAPRMALEVERLAYGKPIVARGPELVSSTYSDGGLTIAFTNSSMVVHKGVVVPPPPGGCSNQTHSTAVTQVVSGSKQPKLVPFKIVSNKLIIDCTKGTEQEPVLVNGDLSTCFLYSSESGLPAPPLAVTCA